MPQCILVVGVMRSGTSAVAGILHHLGIYMGERFIDNGWNAKGSFNDVDWERWSDDVFRGDYRHDKEISEEQLAELATLVQSRDDLGVDWGAKSTCLPIIAERVAKLTTCDVKAIVTRRDVKKSKQSYMDRSGCDPFWGEKIFRDLPDALDLFVAGTSLPILEIQFEELITNQKAAVESISEFTGKSLTSEALSFPDSSLRRY